MIRDVQGDLLAAGTEVLVNPVNTVGVMGKGLALQFRRAFPANYAAYRAACARGEVRLGRMFINGLPGGNGPRLIVNFPTKAHWRQPSRLAYVTEGLVDLVRVLREHRVGSVALPALGCGAGGLAWEVVRPLLETYLAELPEVDVRLYGPVAPGPSPAFPVPGEVAGPEELPPGGLRDLLTG